MEVKLVARTLDLIETFASERRPLSLTELARQLDIPVSSCLGLIRTLQARGYLYEVRRRGGYYPTRRLLAAARRIDSGDPLASLAEEHLQALQRVTGETVVLGKLEGACTLYLSVYESTQAIRYSARAGERRPLHANSISQAILAQLPENEVRQRLDEAGMPRLTSLTLTTPDAYLATLPAVRQRGWSENLGESAEDLAALARAFNVGGEWYAISVAGPLPRMRQHWKTLSSPLLECVSRLVDDVENS